MEKLFSGENAAAQTESTVKGDNYRFSILTSRLIRMEYDPTGRFRDEPTFLAINRHFPTPAFRVEPYGEGVRITTEHLQLTYSGGPFTADSLTVRLLFKTQIGAFAPWRYGDPQPTTDPHFYRNLGGTYRTLDNIDGEVELEPGILAAPGYATLDDSASVSIRDWPTPAPENYRDLYFFGYGQNYRQALDDYFQLSGKNPLLPRWALGNWWSRYHKYTDREYTQLLDRFEAESVPLSVAVIDMDWHLVDIDPKYGNGWTGYTWNRDFFPDPTGFLADLHRRGLKVCLNDHPADGIRAHEDCYADVAKAVGIDPQSGQPIAFDPADPVFLDAYHNQVLAPLEAQGVDFWWMDWQQGTHSTIPGLDPLWMLNHTSYQRECQRKAEPSKEDSSQAPLIFSRYAGPGSHRYPIGFSGDTIVTWDSLRFQPKFTATAANIGYFWWSHDIGGHMFGAKDDELQTRWVQLGCFSPILRLHSTDNEFSSKEPWNFGVEYAGVQKKYLRLRHRLLPYLYTQMQLAHLENQAPVRPLYHDHPGQLEAYKHQGNFAFGSDLIVAPITATADRHSKLAKTQAWLPEGEWIDLQSGGCYRGNSTWTLVRPLDKYPVFAKAGAVIPLSPTLEISDRPERIRLVVACPRNGSGSWSGRLIEAGANGKDLQVTTLQTTWTQTGKEIDLRLKVTGDLQGRSFEVELVGCDQNLVQNQASPQPDSCAFDEDKPTLIWQFPAASDGKTVMEFTGLLPHRDRPQIAHRIISDAQIPYNEKTVLMETIRTKTQPKRAIPQILALSSNPTLALALTELIATCY